MTARRMLLTAAALQRTLALVLLAVLLSSCGGWPDLTEGRVIERDHRPAYSEQYQCGSVPVGDVSVPTYCTRTVPDRWSIVIEADVAHPERDEVKTVRRRVRLARDDFDRVSLGDWWRIGEGVVDR